MPEYRLYCLDAAGRIHLAEWIEAETDEEAIGKAREMTPDAHMCELWLKNRVVAKMDSAGSLEMVGSRSEFLG